MKRIFSLIFILIFSIVSAQNNADDSVFIGGPEYNKQVFKKTAEGNIQISSFNKWELIESIYYNQKFAAVYHRPKGEKAFKLSLFDLSTLKLLGETNPGWSCSDVLWSDNYLIYKWGTSGGGTRLDYYDFNLKFVREINSYNFYIDSDIVISLPVYSEDGDIVVYKYSDGKKIKCLNFRDEFKDNYTVSNCKKINDSIFLLTLQFMNFDYEVRVAVVLVE